jgi:lipopolysaccharide export system protein LptC
MSSALAAMMAFSTVSRVRPDLACRDYRMPTIARHPASGDHEINAFCGHRRFFKWRAARVAINRRNLYMRRGNRLPLPVAPPCEVSHTMTTATGRHDAAMSRALRHSARVRLLKRVLPAAALALIGVFGAAALLANGVGGVSLPSLALEDGRIVMQNPRLNGLTADNKPYVMQAEKAFQSISNPDDIKLVEITADLPFGDSATAKVQAASGHLDNGRKTLKLEGGFTLVTSDGLTGVFEEADIDIGTNSLTTSRPVAIANSKFDIRADAMQLVDGARILIFENQVRMVISPSAIGDARQGGATGAP